MVENMSFRIFLYIYVEYAYNCVEFVNTETTYMVIMTM